MINKILFFGTLLCPILGHANVADDHVTDGVRFKGYSCKRNTGAFT